MKGSVQLTARVVASAFSDGPWTAGAMLRRARLAVGRPRWLKRVVREVLRAFPSGPPKLAELCLAIREVEKFKPCEIVSWPLVVPNVSPRYDLRPLPTVGDVAAWLEIDVYRLDWFADRLGWLRLRHETALHHYHCQWIPKRTTGWRLLEVPKPELAAIQRKILDDILSRVPTHSAAHGFVAGCSPVTAMKSHVGRHLVVRLDLKDFFPTIVRSRVAAIFRWLGYSERVAAIFAGVCTHAVPATVLASAPEAVSPQFRMPHLPQGAPTSPALANLCAFHLDRRLTALAEVFGATYTRYADDLVFSVDQPFAWRATSLVERVVDIAADEGFAINPQKTRYMGRSTQQAALGIVVNERPSIRRTEWKRLEAILVNCRNTSAAEQNRDLLPDFREHLQGKVAWVTHVDPKRGAFLKTLFDAIVWDEPGAARRP